MIRSPYHDLATVSDEFICPENMNFRKYCFQRVGKSSALTRVRAENASQLSDPHPRQASERRHCEPREVSAAQTVFALTPTASRAGRERPRSPAMTLAVGTRFKGHHSEVPGESTVRPLPLHRVPLHRDIFQSEHCCRVPRQ